MKRLLVILIALGLILTGCANINETAKGEESPEEVITQQETKEPVQPEVTEPAEESTEESTENSTEESNTSTSPDGWDVSIGAQSWHDKTPLDDSEIPEVCRGTIIDWMYTDFALIIISSDNYVGYIVDGELVKAWDTEVRGDNFLFDASLFNANAKYRWYGYVGNSIVRIKSDGGERCAFCFFPDGVTLAAGKQRKHLRAAVVLTTGDDYGGCDGIVPASLLK